MTGYLNADPRTDPDAARYAGALAAQMTRWLSQPDANPTTHADSDLIEWCRSARDVLERIGALESAETVSCIYWWHDGDNRVRRCELPSGHDGMHQSGQAYAG